MKKRKKPIFLVAFLVLLVAVVTAMNSNLLSSPKTPEDLAQLQTQQDQQNAQSGSKDQSAKKAVDPKDAPGTTATDDGSLVRQQGEDSPLGVNIKPKDAIPEGAPMITAPTSMKNRLKKPDRASTLPNSGWYYDESGANGNVNKKDEGNK